MNAYETWKAEQKLLVPDGRSSEEWADIINGVVVPDDLVEGESLIEYINRIRQSQ